MGRRAIDSGSPEKTDGQSSAGRFRTLPEVKSVWVGLEDRTVDWYASEGPARLN